jgi:hypothetical protein
MVDAFIEGTEVTEEEVLDIDEDAFREDRLASRLYGYLLVPEVRRFLQPGKASSSVAKSSVQSKQEIAIYVVEGMDLKALYLLGPGTTLRAITDEMRLAKTLLGVDAVHAGVLVQQDVNEKGILSLLEKHERRKIIVTPIGGNGFIFGRGSKQFTPEVIRQVGTDNIIVVGTRDKVTQLDCLRVDTGDLELDEMLSGYTEVTVGYRERMEPESLRRSRRAGTATRAPGWLLWGFQAPGCPESGLGSAVARGDPHLFEREEGHYGESILLPDRSSRKAIRDGTAQHSAQSADVRSESGTPGECAGGAQPGDHRQSQQPHG